MRQQRMMLQVSTSACSNARMRRHPRRTPHQRNSGNRAHAPASTRQRTHVRTRVRTCVRVCTRRFGQRADAAHAHRSDNATKQRPSCQRIRRIRSETRSTARIRSRIRRLRDNAPGHARRCRRRRQRVGGVPVFISCNIQTSDAGVTQVAQALRQQQMMLQVSTSACCACVCEGTHAAHLTNEIQACQLSAHHARKQYSPWHGRCR